ncbi:MAG: AAA family ATPase [Elusimicrobia bacterium]|nr:AAA family ATPase [Elusimicrobiota bacterium]
MALLLTWGELARQVADELPAEAFTDALSREVYAAILALLEAKAPVDLASVAQTLQRAGRIGDLGGMKELMALAHAAVPKEHLEWHVGEVKRAWLGRQIRDLVPHIARDPSEELLEQLQRLAVARNATDGGRAFDLGKDLHDYLEALDRSREAEPAYDTGMAELDGLLGGLKRGNIFTIAGRPGKGKTLILAEIAFRLAEKGLRVVYFSTEMSAHEMVSRLLPPRSRVPAWRFRRAQFEDEHRRRVTDACAEIHGKLAFSIVDKAGPGISDVRGWLAKLKPDVVVLDYLQLFAMPKAENKTREVDAFMTALKTLARESKVVVLLGCQLNRETDRVKVPVLADLRDSGAIEHASDQVLLLHAEQEDRGAPTMELVGILAKNRHGLVGKVQFEVERHIVAIREATSQENGHVKASAHGLARKDAMATNAYQTELDS